MSEELRQLTFDLPHLSATGAEDFMVSSANRAASDMIERWPDWPAPAVFLAGPAGAGKSHLASIWMSRSHAVRCAAPDLAETSVGELIEAPAAVIEDLDRGIGNEKALFYLLNQARDGRLSVLLSARVEPGDLTVTLPDLRSRLRALPVIQIGPPDDALLHALLVKLFADRQLRVGPNVISYLSTHMERSAEAAVRTVAEIDRIALATHRKATPALAGKALRNISDAKL